MENNYWNLTYNLNGKLNNEIFILIARRKVKNSFFGIFIRKIFHHIFVHAYRLFNLVFHFKISNLVTSNSKSFTIFSLETTFRFELVVQPSKRKPSSKTIRSLHKRFLFSKFIDVGSIAQVDRRYTTIPEQRKWNSNGRCAALEFVHYSLGF